jgi:hypothetical protein
VKRPCLYTDEHEAGAVAELLYAYVYGLELAT